MKSGNKLRKPISSGVANVPVIMQMEALECGAACLAMVLAYYGKWISLEQVRTDCGVSRDGANAGNVLRAARGYGLTAKGYRYETETLRQKGTFPCIVHWNFNHFVVLAGFRGKKAYLCDPAKGSYSVPIEVFDESFTGICLVLSPSETFQMSGKPNSVVAFARKRLRGAGTSIVFVVLASLIAALFGVLKPAASRMFLDQLLTGVNPGWIYPFMGAITLLSALELLVSAVTVLMSNRLNARMEACSTALFIWKVLHLPMEFFSQRMAGDILDRHVSNTSIAETLINTLAPLFLNMVIVIVYLVVMLRYSWLLTLVGLTAILLNLVMSRIMARMRINVTRVKMQNEGKLNAATVAGIEMIETLKASGAESGFFERWTGYQANVNTQAIRFSKIDQYMGLIPAGISALSNTLIMALGVLLTMQGEFTIGMVMAFQGFLTAFSAPASALIESGQRLQEMRSEMERVEDVMEYPADPVFEHNGAAAGDDCNKLSGDIFIKGVTFGYSRLEKPLIQDFDLTIKAGSKVAIVGPSGCGKSTAAKLIAGLYQPWSGEILFDGKPMKQIDRGVFTGSLAVVDQEISLFEDTIDNNIRLWDDSIGDLEVTRAARDAQLHEDIMQRQGGYQYRIREGGKDFSGGQRQCMEIARMLAQDPTIIIMDEATSALDARTERDVIDAISNRGITCIMVAHRLSTIRDCDEILVMDRGRIVERGKHDQLVAAGGLYAQLVASE